MAVSYTVTYVDPNGPTKSVIGTFTSAAADGNGETITTSTHGLTNVVRASVDFAPAAIGSPAPKIVITTGGTVTWTVDDTQGLSGRWHVYGN